MRRLKRLPKRPCDVADRSSSLARQPTNRPPSTFGLAARHPLNIIMLGALGAAAVMTGSIWPIAIAVLVEGLWLVTGPRTQAVRAQARWMAKDAATRDRVGDEQALLRQTSEADRRRFLELDQVRRDIRRLVDRHQNLTLDMMGEELHKVDRLLNAYLRLAASTHAQEQILAQSDAADLEVEQLGEPDAESKAVIEARMAQAKTLRASVESSRQQLARVDQQLRLVRDQVATMSRPEDLSEALTDLVETVEVVAATGRETEQIGRGVLQQARSAAVGR